MALMGYFAFFKSPVLLETHYQIVYSHVQDTHCVAYIYILDTYRPNDNRHSNKWRMIKTQEGRRKKTSLEKYSPLTLLQGFERVVQGLHVRGCWGPNINFIFWPHCYDRHVVSFLFSWCWGSTPSGLSEGPLGRVWLSLPHLVSSCLEFYWQLLWHPTQLNYIIIQRPHDRPLDLWNWTFNRHQAEITVMQFTGHSLPVHHCSGTVGPSPCPIL